MPTARSSSRRTEAAARKRRGGAAPRRSAAAAKGAAATRRTSRTELTRLIDLLDRAWSGPSWHGPAVLEALEGVSGADAEARPVARAHTIGELVLHMARWKRAVARRLDGRPDAPSAAENFPPFRARHWRAARAALLREHAALRKVVARLRPERLEAPAVPNGSPCFIQAHGIVHHDLWHAGQILVLRRALEGRGRRTRP